MKHQNCNCNHRECVKFSRYLKPDILTLSDKIIYTPMNEASGKQKCVFLCLQHSKIDIWNSSPVFEFLLFPLLTLYILQADNFKAVERVGIDASHRGLLCDKKVFETIQKWLGVAPLKVKLQTRTSKVIDACSNCDS